MKLLVFIQHEEDKINSVSLETLQAAQEIALQKNGSVTAVIFNSLASKQLEKYDISEVLVINDPILTVYNPLQYLKAMEEIISKESPNLLLLGHTYEARDWIPRLSARLNLPFISDCINFKTDDQLTLVRSIYQGKLYSDVTLNNHNSIVSFQSGSFRKDALKIGATSVREIAVDLSNVNNTIHTSEKFQESESSVDLSQAEVIVSVGRGIGKEDNLQMVRDLASKIGGELASSRPVVDSGWLEPYHQVGSSGQTVAPKLYLALGISGAIQHVVGMKGSKNIVVINKDENAPIFEIADYGIVGDIFEIIPKLIESL